MKYSDRELDVLIESLCRVLEATPVEDHGCLADVRACAVESADENISPGSEAERRFARGLALLDALIGAITPTPEQRAAAEAAHDRLVDGLRELPGPDVEPDLHWQARVLAEVDKPKEPR